MTIEVTEVMLAQLGAVMIERMEDANRWAKRNDAHEVRRAVSVQLGMTEALTILGIPVRQAQREPDGQYIVNALAFCLNLSAMLGIRRFLERTRAKFCDVYYTYVEIGGKSFSVQTYETD